MRMMHWLEKRAAITPERIALITRDETLTFAALRERAQDMAHRLAAIGLKQGDHIALLCNNSIQVPIMIHAIHYLGAVVVPLNTRLTAAEIAYQLEDARCAGVILDEGFQNTALEATTALQANPVIISTEALALLTDYDVSTQLRTHIHSQDLHSIMYTSGTTGHPKGVMLSFDNHWSSAVGSVLNLGLHENDHWLACVPLFHVSGLSILMRSVVYGMTVTLHESFDPRAVNEAIVHGGVTIVSVVSAMLSKILNEQTEDYPAHFRCMLLGGGPAPQPLLEMCRDRKIPVYQTYGMTETASQIVTLPPEYALSKLGSAGKPLFQSEVCIVSQGKVITQSEVTKQGKVIKPSEVTEQSKVSDQGEMGEVLAVGEVGEIYVRGPNVSRGYWSGQSKGQSTHQSTGHSEVHSAPLKAEHERHTLDGWLATGDIGYLDAEGFLYVLDRRSDLIISGGENVYPAEIEAVLLSHPSIAEAGVVGIPDERWGQVPIAFVVLREGAIFSEKQLLEYSADKLAKYKLPTKIHQAKALPRNATNKLLRRELLTLLRTQRSEGNISHGHSDD